MSRKPRKQKRRSNAFAIFSITCIVLMLFCVLTWQTFELKKTAAQYSLKEENVQKELASEESRSESLKEEEVYVQTKQYIEEQAKIRFGLVYPNEIILKPNSD